MSEMIIKCKIEGKEVSLKLTQNEVASAISICEKNSVEEITAMKFPHKGGALFFTNPVSAASCQDRHKFEYAFTVKLSELRKFKPSEAPAVKADPKDAEIVALKEELKILRKNESASTDSAKIIGDKDAEIELLKEESKGKSDELGEMNKALALKDAEIAKLKK